MRLTITPVTVALRRPFTATYGTLSERELVQVTLTDEHGVAGHGEAAPLEPYDGVALGRVIGALERYREALEQLGEEDAAAPAPGLPPRALEACRALDGLPQALAAIDLALWDRAGRLRGLPAAVLIAEHLAALRVRDVRAPLAAVPVNAVIAAEDRAGAAAESAAAVGEGFTCLKLKVGVGDDAGRVAAVRAAAGPATALRLDANGAWDPEQAVRSIETLAPAGLELVEEPCSGLAAIREVRERVSVRVAIDETAAEPGALGSGAADAVCLKISRCGGIRGLIDAAVLVAASGAQPYLASTLDGPLGIAAALHAAAALGSIAPLPASGLSTLSLFAGLDDALSPRDGAIALPAGPGLGVAPLGGWAGRAG